MRTNNKTRMPCKFIMADRTFFGGISRIDIDNPASFSYSFIFNKILELPKCPLMHPFVISCSFSNIAQIFHYNGASFKNTINDSFAYVMVSPCHKLSPSSRELSQMLLSRFCAFGLKYTNQFITFDSERFNLFPEEHLGRCYGEIVYADINPKNFVLETRAFRINIFGECEQEKTSAFFINSQKTFNNIPSEVLLVTTRNSEWNFNSAFNCGYTQDIILEGSRTREIISYRASIDYWFGLSLLDHSTGLFDTSNSQLGWQSLSEGFVNKWMEFNVIPYFVFPSSINTELQSFAIDPESINYLLYCNNSDFSCCSCFHNGYKEPLVFKSFGGGIPLHPNCFAIQDAVSCQL